MLVDQSNERYQLWRLLRHASVISSWLSLLRTIGPKLKRVGPQDWWLGLTFSDWNVLISIVGDEDLMIDGRLEEFRGMI